MESYIIPSTPSEWAELVHDSHAADPFNLDISSISPGTFGSASKLKYEDWLLLRVLWKKKDGRTTHGSIFGTKGQELRATAQRRLATEPWMQALKAKSDNAMEWSYMAPWKLNLSEILQRVPSLRSLDETKIFDDADPFRLLVEPSNARRRPHRNIVPPQYFGRDAGGSGFSDRSSTHSSSSVSSSRTHYVSPTQSDRLAASSGAAGSLRGRDGASTPESGLSAEGRMVNRHRPDEALINMTLLLLLQGVCMPLLQQTSRKSYTWSIVHKQFSISHADPDDRTKRSKIMTARTDGCLQVKRGHHDPDNSDALVIIEVKPYLRVRPKNNEKAVQIQEGAEMAAWISTESMKGLLPALSGSKKYRRLLISQDFDQVYVTVAEYDDLYVQHIRGDSIKWPKITPEATPSKQGRPSDDPPGGTSGEEPLGKPSKGSKGTKPTGGLFGAFKSSSKDSQSSKQSNSPPPPTPLPAPASTRLPSRIRPLPVTPSKTRPEETPQAPKQSMSKDVKLEDGGFLVMHQFDAFELGKPAHVEELVLLLYSLTDYLTERDAAQTLQLERSSKRPGK